MSTKTNNLKMTLPTGTENITRSVINGNFEIVDAAVGSVQDGLAIVSDGDTHGAIANGQFVYVRNHNTLAEGLYKARAAIGANVALSTSNLTANGSGGLNDLQSQVNTLNSQFGGLIGYKTTASGANNNTLIINLESTTSTKEYMILGYGISSGQQIVGFILYARASTGLAIIKSFGDRSLTATYSNGTVLIKGGTYTALCLVSSYPITTEWTNT